MTDAEKRRRFERALRFAGDTHTPADVIQKIKDGRARLFDEGETFAVCEVLVYPRKRFTNVWLTSGTLEDCHVLEPQIVTWAKENECSAMVATGRMGWQRVAHQFGWRPQAIKFVKQLTDGA